MYADSKVKLIRMKRMRMTDDDDERPNKNVQNEAKTKCPQV